jgi:excinuclease ABC subunit A
MEYPLGSRLYITARVVFRQKGEHKGVFEKYLKAGYLRALVEGEMVDLEDGIPAL